MIVYDKNDSTIQHLLDEGILDADKEGKIFWKGKRKPLYLSPSGYLRALIRFEKKTLKLCAHRIVLVKFLGSQPLETDHIDSDRTNNMLSNLQYATRSQNVKKREHPCPRRVLSDSELAEAREKRKNGESIGSLARFFRVSHKVMHDRLEKDYKRPYQGRGRLLITAFGETMGLREWSRDKRCLVSHFTLKYRLDRGIAPELAIGTAPRPRRSLKKFLQSQTLSPQQSCPSQVVA